jgi:hypothetical protein
MTVFLIDARYTTRLGEVRTEIFGKDFSGDRGDHGRQLRAAGDDDRGSVRCGGLISAEPSLTSRLRAAL